MNDFYVSAPDFVNAVTREKIVPWTHFDDHREFLIERSAIGDIEIKDTLFLVEKYGLCQLRLAGLGPDEETLRNYFKSIGQVMSEQNMAKGEINDLRPQVGIEPNTGSRRRPRLSC